MKDIHEPRLFIILVSLYPRDSREPVNFQWKAFDDKQR